MLYSIQNSGGDVYGFYKLPRDINLTIDEWEERLGAELEDILGINGVKSSDLMTDDGPVERVVVDIDPYGDEEAKIDRVHTTVGFVALTSELDML